MSCGAGSNPAMCLQESVLACITAQFLKDYLSCPAVLTDQKSTQNVEAIRPAKMDQGDGVEH
jgi:hypothetical protein